MSCLFVYLWLFGVFGVRGFSVFFCVVSCLLVVVFVVIADVLFCCCRYVLVFIASYLSSVAYVMLQCYGGCDCCVCAFCVGLCNVVVCLCVCSAFSCVCRFLWVYCRCSLCLCIASLCCVL